MVGRWMAGCPGTVPWWRVIAKDGRLPLGKRSPELAADQQRRLEEEGVKIEGDLVSKAAFISLAELMEAD